MKKAAFIYDPQLSTHVLRDDHVMRPSRLQYTFELLDSYGAFDGKAPSLLLSPRKATEEEVLTFHTREYLEAVKLFSRGEHGPYDPLQFNFSQYGDNPVYPGMYEAALLSTGASLVAAELVLNKEVPVAFNISGGLHHAMPGHASGFCIFNDPVIAINYLLKHVSRVAYVDIDCHHGDGVQAAFYNTDRVLTISLHESGRWLFPGTGDVTEIGQGRGLGYSVNVPLAPYTTDEMYLWAFREVVLPLLHAYRPDVLVTQLGVDTHFNDPITHLALTSQGFTACVEEFRNLVVPWLALGGGGYDMSAVARCWTLAYGVMAGLELPEPVSASYRERYGITHLRESEKPPVEPEMHTLARRFAEESVREVKRLVFPVHRLT
jgi:acetoin utilization protein AcuC